MKNKSLKVYSCKTDEFISVTQEWVDAASNSMNKLSLQRELIRKLANLNITNIQDLDKLEAVSSILV